MNNIVSVFLFRFFFILSTKYFPNRFYSLTVVTCASTLISLRYITLLNSRHKNTTDQVTNLNGNTRENSYGRSGLVLRANVLGSYTGTHTHTQEHVQFALSPTNQNAFCYRSKTEFIFSTRPFSPPNQQISAHFFLYVSCSPKSIVLYSFGYSLNVSCFSIPLY